MDYFLAKSDKQLGICLRMLYAEDIQGRVEVVMNRKHKIEYHIKIDATKAFFDELSKRYDINISYLPKRGKVLI